MSLVLLYHMKFFRYRFFNSYKNTWIALNNISINVLPSSLQFFFWVLVYLTYLFWGHWFQKCHLFCSITSRFFDTGFFTKIPEFFWLIFQLTSFCLLKFFLWFQPTLHTYFEVTNSKNVLNFPLSRQVFLLQIFKILQKYLNFSKLIKSTDYSFFSNTNYINRNGYFIFKTTQ